MAEKVKILIRWFVFAGLVLVTVPGCGKGGEGETLRVSVQIPAGEPEDLFWFGVEQRVLQVESGGELSKRPWVSGQSAELGLREGDGLVFVGQDREGRVLVTGEVKVGKAKMVTIPLRRIL